jgi:hypothetical protein
VEASSRSKHVGQVATLHHRQLVVHAGKAGVTLLPGVRKGALGSFGEELHRSGAKAPQRFKGNGTKRISRACMVGVVVPTVISVPVSSRMARGASGGTEVRGGKETDERDVPEYVARARAQVAMEVPAGLGAVEGVGGKPRVSPLSVGGEAQAANKFSEHVSGVILAALYEITEPVAAEG